MQYVNDDALFWNEEIRVCTKERIWSKTYKKTAKLYDRL